MYDVPPAASGDAELQILREHLEMAAKNTMPPHSGIAVPAGWPDGKGCFPPAAAPLKGYFASLRMLRAMCSGEKQAFCDDDG